MLLRRLTIDGIRSLAAVDLVPGPGINLLIGANGAGKTSILEAIHLLSRGRSFRAGADDALLGRDREAWFVHAETGGEGVAPRRLGLGRDRAGWTVRIDGADQATLGSLLEHCAVVTFEPGSHELISGPAQERRRYLDWGVFHVEHDFLSHWRRYQRALRQRNKLLRDTAPDSLLAPWEHELASAAAFIDAQRGAYIARLAPSLRLEIDEIAPQLGAVTINYRRGWPEDTPLEVHLAQARERDRQRGHTTAGPHRADFRLAFERAPNHAHLSRGQEKLAALACSFAQASLYLDTRGTWPIFCLDDLASELDREHRARVLARIRSSNAQTWITGTEPIAECATGSTMFHVEHGRVRSA